MVAVNLIADLAKGLTGKASPAQFKRLVGPHWSQILRLAKPEEEFHETVTRRSQRAVERAGQMGDALGVLGPATDTRAVARAMVQQSLHTTDPSADTGLIAIPKGAFDAPPPVEVTKVPATATASPVHVPGDGTTPPVPADEGEGESADGRSPLPRRIPYGESAEVIEHSAKTDGQS